MAEEEQSMELEALEAILMDDLEELTDSVPRDWTPVGKVFRVVVNPHAGEGEGEVDYPVRLEVVFAHTPNYPDEPPLLKVRGLQGLSDAEMAVLQATLEEQVTENLGMAMIYTLITSAQEWLQEKASVIAAPSVDPALERKKAIEAEEARLAAIRAHGTMVTPEAFAEWRARFDAEQALARADVGDAEASGAGAADKAQRPSGKQWFMAQDHLAEPGLGEGEVGDDGEAGVWSGSEGGEDAGGVFSDSDEDEEDEELLDELLAAKGG